MSQTNPKGATKSDGTRPARNKGIARANQERKREEAEARNALTNPDNRRAARLAAQGAS